MGTIISGSADGGSSEPIRVDNETIFKDPINGLSIKDGAITPSKLSEDTRQLFAQKSDVGDLNNLDTSEKNSLVGAMNEIKKIAETAGGSGSGSGGGSGSTPTDTYTKTEIDSKVSAVDSRHTKKMYVLSFGNSYACDCLSHVPFLLDKAAPNVDWVFGILYYPGCSLQQHLDFWNGNSATYTFYKIKKGDSAWGETANATIDMAINAEDWNVMLLQQMSMNSPVYDTYQPYLNSLCRKIFNRNRNVKLGWLITQASMDGSGRFPDVITDPDSNFQTSEDMMRGQVASAKKVMLNTPVEFVLQCGIAIQYARQTSLNQYGGTYGGMAANDGYHMGEGLGSLVPAYLATMKLMEVLHIEGTIYGDTLRPSLDWVNLVNIPGRGNVVYGMDKAEKDDNAYIAQAQALKALKFTYGDWEEVTSGGGGSAETTVRKTDILDLNGTFRPGYYVQTSGQQTTTTVAGATLLRMPNLSPLVGLTMYVTGYSPATSGSAAMGAFYNGDSSYTTSSFVSYFRPKNNANCENQPIVIPDNAKSVAIYSKNGSPAVAAKIKVSYDIPSNAVGHWEDITQSFLDSNPLLENSYRGSGGSDGIVSPAEGGNTYNRFCTVTNLIALNRKIRVTLLDGSPINIVRIYTTIGDQFLGETNPLGVRTPTNVNSNGGLVIYSDMVDALIGGDGFNHWGFNLGHTTEELSLSEVLDTLKIEEFIFNE
ncbi:MAG: DUF4886 domain-containing protein [Bacteroidales bacterium]|nr:DUF4886 domain-containing protein [Candidatus Colimorpha merdihippi]